MKISACILIVLLLCSCSSPTRAIANSANKVSRLAYSSEDRFETIAEESTDSETTENAEAGAEEQGQIIDLIEGIHTNLQGVEDRVPWWATLLDRFLIFGVIVGAIILLWQTGIGHLIKRLFWAVGWFIPSKVKQEVDMDMDMMRSENPATLRESIAAKRANPNGAYNAAWKLRKKGRS